MQANWRRIFSGAILGILLPVHGLHAVPSAGVAPMTVPAGGFAIEGNLLANTPTNGVGDWIAMTNLAPGAGGGVLASNGTPLNATTTFHFLDPFSSAADTIMTGGSASTNPNAWTWGTGTVLNKEDMNNGLVHVGRDSSNHTWVAVSADHTGTGNADMYLFFLQNTLTKNGNGTFTSAGPHAGFTMSDLRLKLNFAGDNFVVDQWQTNTGGGYQWEDVSASLPTNRVFLAVNPGNTYVPYGTFGSTNCPAGDFVEAAADFAALVGNINPCASVGFKNVFMVTLHPNGSMSDFIDPIPAIINIGLSADAGPNQTNCYQGTLTTFSLSGTIGVDGTAAISTNWSVISGGATITSPGSLNTTVQVPSTTAGTNVTLRLTITSTCTNKTDDVVLTVAPLPPSCLVTGATTVCPVSTNQFSGPVGGGSYAWSITGNGSITGPTNQQTVQVIAGTNCNANFTLFLTTTSNICTISCSTVVAVVDTNAPLLTCPGNLVLDCPAVTTTNVTGVATATDGCSRATVTYSDSVTNLCGPTKVIARTWTATDACGNSASCVQTITVRDITPPVISCPTNRTLEFPANTSPANTGAATATDTCDSATVTFSDLITTNCGNAIVISRTWTATDQCSNTASCTQTITVRDTTAPVLTCPTNRTLGCPAVTTTNVTGVATASDTGSPVMISYADTTTNQCGNTYTISRRWTATDQCNNSSSCTQTITVRDTTAPVITCPTNRTLGCPAVTTTNVMGVATATDTCGSATIMYADTITNGCGNTYVISRRWTATDQCSNSASCTQTITVRDTTPPVITCPTNRTLECPAVTTTNATGVATATDTCGSITISYADTTTNGCGNSYVISRRWTATDQCTNSSSCTQTITVRDTTAPVITCPTNRTLDCPAVTTTNATGVATATDTCGSFTITYADTTTPGCGNSYVISRRWTATDQCTNSSSCTQTITVRDITPPVLTCPTNRTLDCPAVTTTNVTGVATATDACSSVTVSFADATTNLCGGTKIITRTWTATDSCSNKTSCVQIITVRDLAPPTLTTPTNRVLTCPGDTRTNVTGVATATDVCGSVTVSYSDVVSNGCGLTRTVLRLWTATDQCGNTTNRLQTIAVTDTQKPTINCPTVSVQCAADVPPPYTNLAGFLTAGGTATDSCDAALTFSLISNSVLVGSCPGAITRVYRVIDDCGNFADCTQQIVVDDTIAPTLTCPASLTVECGALLNPTNTGFATATDNCDTNATVAYSDTPVSSIYSVDFYAADPDAGSGSYSPTYLKLSPANLPCPPNGRAQDPLRNAVAFGSGGSIDALTTMSSTTLYFGQVMPFQAIITMSGAPGPEKGKIEFTADWSTHTTSNDRFGYSTNYMVYCAFVDPGDLGTIDPNTNARVDSVTSTLVNRGSVDEQIRGTFRVSGLDPGDRIVVEMWVVLNSAASGNPNGTISAGLVSANKLTTPPVPISASGNTTSINANKVDPLPTPQAQPPLPPLPPQPAVGPGRIVSAIDRTWTATDDCGNQGNCVQRFTIRDTTPPVITLTPSVTLDCPSATTTNVTGVAVAQDACGAATLTYSDVVVSNGCNNTKTIARTWTAIDENGNSTNKVQTITVRDITPPALSVPTNVTLQCSGDTRTNSTGVATTTDACGSVTLAYSDLVAGSGACDQVITRTWTATDPCGNTTNKVQTITVRDTIPPTLSALTNKTITNGMALVFDTPGAFDACGVDWIAIVSTTTNILGPDTYAVTRTWRAADFCGNISSNGSQTITVLPQSSPVRLSATRLASNSVVLYWPTNYTGYSLERSSNLTNWSPLAASLVQTNGELRVYLSPTNPYLFYRLMHP